MSSHKHLPGRLIRTTFTGTPNATAQPRLEAGATEERTLEGVGCSRLFGLVVVPTAWASDGLPESCPLDGPFRHGASSLRDTPGRH